jgi:hypothetical protein
MSKPTLRSWSMDEWIDFMTKKNKIKTPFTREERDLARNSAAAYYYYHSLGELPDRAREAGGEGLGFFTPELFAFHMGVFKVRGLQGEFPDLAKGDQHA